MANLPTISVIVPVYRVELWLRECVDSILGQTFRDFELILVDDGSPDSCGAICDEYAHLDSRVRVIHKANGGLSSARNAGLDIARGAYVLFIDSDDFIEEHTLQRLVQTAEQHHADVVMFNFDAYYPPAYTGWKSAGSSFSDAVMNSAEFAAFLARSEHWPACIACNKLYRRHIWEDLSFPESYIHEDEAVIHHVVEQCQTIAIIADQLYHYRQNVSTSIMGQGIRIASFDKLTALADRIVCASKNGWQELTQAAISGYIYYLLEFLPKFPRTAENEKYFRRMEDSLKHAYPYLLKAKTVSIRHKVYLTAIRLNPKIYTVLKHLIKG